jgi:hypothetical protein
MTHARLRLLLALSAAAFAPVPAPAQGPTAEVVMYKTESCSCCGKWVEHMQKSGFRVVSHNVQDLAGVKVKHRVPAALGSCHTALVAGYAIEGHVPADAVRRLLKERPAGVIGIAVPGMPPSAPGMDSPVRTPYDVVVFDAKGASRVYERR